MEHMNRIEHRTWSIEKITDIKWPFDLRNRIEIPDRLENPQMKIKIGLPLQREIPRIQIIQNS